MYLVQIRKTVDEDWAQVDKAFTRKRAKRLSDAARRANPGAQTRFIAAVGQIRSVEKVETRYDLLVDSFIAPNATVEVQAHIRGDETQELRAGQDSYTVPGVSLRPPFQISWQPVEIEVLGLSEAPGPRMLARTEPLLKGETLSFSVRNPTTGPLRFRALVSAFALESTAESDQGTSQELS